MSLNVRLPGPDAGNVWLPFSGTAAASSTATGARPVLMMMSSSAGVGVGSLGRQVGLVLDELRAAASSGPGAATGTKALQVASGVGVLPVRTLIATLVPAGVVAVH